MSNTSSPTSSSGTAPPPQKRVKLILSGLKLKTFIASKDAENNGISSNALPTQPLPITVLPDFAAINGNNNNKNVVYSTAPPYQLASVSGCSAGNDSSADESIGSNGNSVLKTVVRKRAPVFPFEPEDHYVPDNNSNNIISKHDIHPPPTSAERRQGYCLRPFRYISDDLKKSPGKKNREVKYNQFHEFFFDQIPFFAISKMAKSQFMYWEKV